MIQNCDVSLDDIRQCDQCGVMVSEDLDLIKSCPVCIQQEELKARVDELEYQNIKTKETLEEVRDIFVEFAERETEEGKDHELVEDMMSLVDNVH